ncbi:MAG: CPBP family intramembrane metalloprotease [Paenibacillaceae bacterium]|nr:CPBP family intramembrane metalloprotease [Paenibacillaceae bacterium]
MKKWDWKQIRLRKVDISAIDDRMLLINLYVTQALTLIIGMIVLFFQHNRDIFARLRFDDPKEIVLWGACFAAVVLIADLLIARFVPEEVGDDGGVNDMLFRNRPLWHIAVISLVVAICEELLFRGAVQHAFGPYWTSILFAAIHIRYLRHWLMTGLVFSISYGLGWIYIRTGSLWTPILAHFMIDFVMGCIIRYRRDSE